LGAYITVSKLETMTCYCNSKECLSILFFTILNRFTSFQK